MLYPPELRGHWLGRYERPYQSRQLPGKPDKIVSNLFWPIVLCSQECSYMRPDSSLTTNWDQ